MSDTEYVKKLDYKNIEFPVKINYIPFCPPHASWHIGPHLIYTSKEKFKDDMELLLRIEGKNGHYVEFSSKNFS